MKTQLSPPFGHADDQLPSLAGIQEAQRRIAPYLQPSPLYGSPSLSGLLGCDVYLKVETVNQIGCFKLRGALNSMLAARESGVKLAGACTSSTGNHGQGVAYAARILGIPAHIFVPGKANPVKVDRIRRLGAQVHVAGTDIDEAKAAAMDFSRARKIKFVDDGEDLHMMNGAGTVGNEITDRVPDLDHAFVPMGSGTLAAGCAAAIKSKRPTARVTTVQPTGSPAMTMSFKERRAVEHPIESIAEGLHCRVPAKRAVDAILRWVDDAILVEDQALLASIRTLVEHERLLVEPSGAATLAGAWSKRRTLKGKKVVLVLTGSNLSMETLHQALGTPGLGATTGKSG